MMVPLGWMFVQTSAEVFISVIPAKAGIQWLLVTICGSSLGSGFRRSDGENLQETLTYSLTYSLKPRGSRFIVIAACQLDDVKLAKLDKFLLGVA